MNELSEEFYAQREASRTYDYRLANILDMMFGFDDQHKDSSIALSVLVAGATVRGLAIHRESWETEQIEKLQASGEPSHDMLAQMLKAMFDTDSELDADFKAEYPERRYVRRWIHFRDATVSTGGQAVEYPYFRVSLDSVQGWSLGS